MHLVHIGIAVTLTGIVLVKHYETERDVRMAPATPVAAGGYSIRFLGVEDALAPLQRRPRQPGTAARTARS